MSGETTPAGSGLVVRRSERGWQVGTEETADLTGAMVLADLLAAARPGGRPSPANDGGGR